MLDTIGPAQSPPDRPRIVVVTPWYPSRDAPESGLFVAREVAALAMGFDVRVLHLDWSRRAPTALPEEGPVQLRRVALRRANPFDYIRARRLVRRASAGAAVLHTHALTGLIPWILGRPAALPWVHSEHWSALTSRQRQRGVVRVALAVLAPLLRRPDVVVAESVRLAEAVKRHRSSPTVIVPCVVPPPRALQARPLEEMAMLGIGGLIDRKDPLTAVAAVGELRRRGFPATLTWVGDGPLRQQVQDYASASGVDDAVTLLGTLPTPRVEDAIDAASLLLLPTRGDNFCVVVAETLTRGRPVVSGSETGAVDYSVPAVSRFVPIQAPEAYADAVVELVESSRSMTAEDIAATVRDRFTPTAVRSALESAYSIAGATL